MADPTIPLLALANDHSQVGIDNNDTYGLHFEIHAKQDWIYKPEGRFPKYKPQIVISIAIGSTPNALCLSQSVAGQIVFKESDRQAVSPGVFSSKDNTYSWTVTITPSGPDNDIIIGTSSALAIDMAGIKPNNVEGNAPITLLPRLKAKDAANPDIDGTPLTYTVEKTSPPIVIDNVAWSPGVQPGPGTLTWQVTGSVKGCTLRANGEEIGHDPYHGENSQYQASLILQMGTRYVTIMAEDKNHNTAAYTQDFNFNTFNPFFVLQVASGLPLSLVQSDQQACLYGVFSNIQDGIQIWANTNSGTQDNWQNTGLTLKAGYGTSPCVHYNGQFYLLGGSRFDFSDFQNQFWTFQENAWHAIPVPDGWKSEPRIGQSVALFDQAIWIAGGYGASGKVYNDVYSYNKQAGWKQQPSLPQALCNASLAAAGDNLYLFGGYADMPGGSASTKLYCLAQNSWVDQHKDPPPGLADYWALGSVAGNLLLLGSFGGSAFTGQLSSAPHWQGGDENFSLVVRSLVNDTRPYGLTTFTYKTRLFLMITTSQAHSVFACYETSGSKGGRRS